MSDALDGLTSAQHAVVTHHGGPLLVLGGAGSGKTRALRERALWLVGEGAAPEALLAVCATPAAADAMRASLEDGLERAFEELCAWTFPDLCARILRDEAGLAGLEPLVEPLTRADRLALLLERLDELGLRRHDFGPHPAALLASFVARIDELKHELVTPEAYAAWAQTLDDGDEAGRQREFAAVFATHDRMLAETGRLDGGDVVLRAHALLAGHPEVRARLSARFGHLLVDDLQDAGHAQLRMLGMLATDGRSLVACADDDASTGRRRSAATLSIRRFRVEHPEAPVLTFERSHRCGREILRAAEAVVAPDPDRLATPLDGPPGGEVHFWRCLNERAQAQAVAADVERLITREGADPAAIAVLVRSVTAEAQPVAVALEERAVAHRTIGAAAFFQRLEIRDLLAWLRLLIDPGDHAAFVRALARPPVELRSVDLARCIQIARRRKLDMVAALVAATESPQVAPEARERILGFLKLHRSAAAAVDTTRPDLYVHRLIDRLGLRRQQLFAAQADVVARLVNLARFGELAAAHARRSPQATAREFARYIVAVAEAGIDEAEEGAPAEASAVTILDMDAARGREWDHVYVLGLNAAGVPGARSERVEPIPDALLAERLPPDSHDAHVAAMRRLLRTAMTRARRRVVLAHPERSESGARQPPSPFAEEARAAVSGVWERREEELFGPAETLHATFRVLRDELLETIARTGSRLGELRFDTELDVSHAVVRYLELVKLSALIARPDEQPVAEALPLVNQRLLSAVTAEQREILQSSVLDEYLLDADRDQTRRAQVVAARDEPSLEAFLPIRGDGLALSASDVETYRICPLRYKFARVFRIPQEPTVNQRFGILVHQVLERFHAVGAGGDLRELLGLLDSGWRRQGLGDGDRERQLRAKAEQALRRYHARFESEAPEPVWFERSFSFKLGPHLLRGRVDRVDRLPGGGYELIDYKTGRPRSPAQLRDDVQLSLYAVGAREAWQLDAASQAYYYVLDDEKVPVPRDEDDRERITETVLGVADGIRSQDFEPTPSYTACSMCDYRIACPAAER